MITSLQMKKEILGPIYQRCQSGFVEQKDLEQRMFDAINAGLVKPDTSLTDFVKLCELKYESVDLSTVLERIINDYFRLLLSNQKVNVLSSGGNGKIISVDNNDSIVFKLIYSGCKSFEKEFLTQARLYNALRKCKSNKLKIPQPYKYFPEPLSVGDESFNCAFAMEKIQGVPSDLITDNRACVTLFPTVQILLVFNPRFNNMLFLKDRNEECSLKNPPRYVSMFIDTFDIDKNKLCFDLGEFFGMASFDVKVSLDDVELIIDKDNKVYLVDFGYCKDLSKLVNSYLENPSEFVDELVENGIANYSTPFLTKEGFPTPVNTICWKHFIDGFKSSLKRLTSLSEQDSAILIQKIEQALI